jgi:hypothetical protein
MEVEVKSLAGMPTRVSGFWLPLAAAPIRKCEAPALFSINAVDGGSLSTNRGAKSAALSL